MNDTAPESPPPWREDSRALLNFACGTRPDWTREETWAAIHAAKTAGLEWKSLSLRLMAIAFREEEPPTRPRELWDYARGITGPATRGALDPGLSAALRKGDYASVWAATHDGTVPAQIARATGPQQALTEDNDSSQEAP